MKTYTKKTAPKKSGIYVLICPDTKKPMYVGQSVNIRKRFLSHLNDTSCYSKKSEWVSSVLSQGKEIILSVVEFCSRDELEEREIYWTNHYGIENLLNSVAGTPKKITRPRSIRPWSTTKSPFGFWVLSVKNSLPKDDKGNEKRDQINRLVRDAKKLNRWYILNLAALYRSEFLRSEFEGRIDYKLLGQLAQKELDMAIQQ